MATQRPRPRQAAPFVTRRSTLAFSGVCVIASLGFQSLAGGSGAGTSASLLLALTGAVALVFGAIAWFAGVVIAVRAGSLLWMVVAALPVPPLNSVVCAMFCPAAPGEARK